MTKEEYNDISAAFDRTMTRVANDDTLPKKAAIGAFGVLAGLQLFIKEYYEKHTTDTPKGLNEAFRSFMNSTEYPPSNQDEEKMALDALNAGAKWMAEQFVLVGGEPTGWFRANNGSEYATGLDLKEPIKLPVDFYVRKK